MFLSLLCELPERYGVIVHGYALMPNHFHLLLQTPHANLSQAMCFLTGRYSRDLNRRFEWDGPLFRARYKNRVVEDEDYWRDLLAYIHLNPVKAGLATSPDNADWTSHQAYTGLGPAPAWLTCEEMLGLYGSLTAYRSRLRDLATGRAAMHPDWEIAAWDEARVSARVAASHPTMLGSRRSGEFSIDQLVSDVFRVTDRSRDQLTDRASRAPVQRGTVGPGLVADETRSIDVHRSEPGPRGRRLRSESHGETCEVGAGDQ